MKSIRPLASSDREAWDRLVAGHGASGFMQSWDWSRFKELEGYTVLRLGLWGGGGLRGGAMAYLFPHPAEAAVAAIPDGPVLDWESPSAPRDLKDLTAALLAAPEARRVAIVRMEPRLSSLPPALAGRWGQK